ncbi:hypothetical protein [Streptomyces sp. NPDC089919]|uniref:hypothetical protein n=1 Tax=Streptomyces sp. NPDC089919 TaxID=3155188 RepID=UPI0034240BBB
MRRTMAALGTTVALGALVTVAGPGQAQAAPSCKSAIQVLGALPGSGTEALGERVHALGAGNLSVGVSQSKAVYWTGTTVHRVPVPDKLAFSELLGVNQQGLMAGRYLLPGGDWAGFTYRAGDAAVALLPRTADASASDVDVDDHGRVIVGGFASKALRVYEGDTVRVLNLPAELADGWVEALGGANARGDVVATVTKPDPATEGRLELSYPVLWPGDGGPAQILPQTGNTSLVTGIANDGTVVGSDWSGFTYQWTPWVWGNPVGTPGSSPGDLAGHDSTSLEAIAPNTKAVVGVGRDHPDFGKPEQAAFWPGSGPLLALPGLAAHRASEAFDVTDDDRAGGYAVNSAGKARAVVWKCASKLAVQPY